MGRIATIFRTALQSTVSDQKIRDHEAIKQEIARGIVRRTATGNVNLQRGRYVTKEDIEASLQAAKGYSVDGPR